ncbi:MAG TPA: hypothetical protein DD454_01480 [Candidatus Moranbacteria bacterium]|nr:hypothetical protein [Candidatus Moranbacteria bacterium]
MKKVLQKISGYKWLLAILLIFIGGAFYFGYGKEDASSAETAQPEISTVRKKDIFILVSGSGQVYSRSQVDIKPQVAGDGIDVLSVSVKNDQRIKKGNLIAVLDYSDAQKSVRNAEIDLENAELKYEDVKDDYEDDRATSIDKKMQKLAIEQKDNSLADAKEKLSDYYIRAPFDGIVTGVSVEAGSSVSRSDVLASVITEEMYAKVSLNEVDAVSVEVGDRAVLVFDAIEGLEMKGEVSKIDTIGTVEQGVVYYEAEISFDKGDEKIKPGMSVSAEITTDSKSDVLSVPASAIKTGSAGKYIQVVDNEKTDEGSFGNEATKSIYYVEKIVEIGISDGSSVEILSGVSEGESVVVKAPSVSSKSANPSLTQTQGLLNSVRIPGAGGGIGR